MTWHSIKFGDENSRPLVLLHGVGMSASAWLPVVDLLKTERRVIAYDLPGHGKTPPFPKGCDLSPKAMAEKLKQVLETDGISEPVDIVGNSLGGYIALEFAKLGYARSVVGISPAGLWKNKVPFWIPFVLGVVKIAVCQPFRFFTLQIIKLRFGRWLVFKIPVSAKGSKISKKDAKSTIMNFASTKNLRKMMMASAKPFRNGNKISAPCTIAFGDKDWLLLKKNAQLRDQLPEHHIWSEELQNCGHVPMWDNPEKVAEIILSGTK